jgi:hypothetical protein
MDLNENALLLNKRGGITRPSRASSLRQIVRGEIIHDYWHKHGHLQKKQGPTRLWELSVDLSIAVPLS